MQKMLLHYYEQKLASWILFTPVAASFLGLPLLFESTESAAYFILSICITVLCATYLDMRESELVMTSLFPVHKKTYFIVDLSFLGRYTLYYNLYTLAAATAIQTMLERQLVLPSVNQLVLSFGISFSIIAIFLLIRRVKFGYFLNLSTVFLPVALIQFLSFFEKLATFQSIVLFFVSLFVLIIAACITYFREYRRDVL